jgi:hypothetical protein
MLEISKKVAMRLLSGASLVSGGFKMNVGTFSNKGIC